MLDSVESSRSLPNQGIDTHGFARFLFLAELLKAEQEGLHHPWISGLRPLACQRSGPRQGQHIRVPLEEARGLILPNLWHCGLPPCFYYAMRYEP